MNTTQFLLYLDAPTGVHQALALNMIKGIGPFKMQESEIIQLTNEMKGAKDANSVIFLHSGATMLAVDKFEDLVDALNNVGTLATPPTCFDPKENAWILKTDLKAPSKIEVPSLSVVSSDADPNKLRSH